MKESLLELTMELTKQLETVTSEHELNELKSKYLGKNSILTSYYSELKDMSAEDKKIAGSLLNDTKEELQILIEQKRSLLSAVTIPDFDETFEAKDHLGSLHPVTIVAKEVTDILVSMGFTVISGDEMETDYYNFEALNIPSNHPARDMQDTFWLSNGMLLRTHTSPNQVKGMEMYNVPLKICAPGRCFRNEDIDASHENTFFQVEGMVIDKDVSIGNLIYVMEGLLKRVFNKSVDVRLRPGFFPFVEPGFELDCSCVICDGKGCPTCKGTGWIELCPCGMIHPNVLEMSGVDSKVYNGFAFGLGLTRLAMMKYKIGDIRLFNSGDLRKITEFNIN